MGPQHRCNRHDQRFPLAGFQKQVLIDPINDRIGCLADEGRAIRRQILGRTFQRKDNNEQEQEATHSGERNARFRFPQIQIFDATRQPKITSAAHGRNVRL